MPQSKRCKKCDQTKSLIDFTCSAGGYYNSYCKKCAAAKSKESYKANYNPRPRKSYKFKEEIEESYQNGTTLAELSRTFNISLKSLHNWKNSGLLVK